jgi:hypothetical protein
MELVCLGVLLSCVPNPLAYSKQAASCTFLSTGLLVVFSVNTNAYYERKLGFFVLQACNCVIAIKIKEKIFTKY